jgi:glycosyltransferase involved in cell wall biosynthesis
LQVIAKQNGGIVSARKAGVRIATGDYIMFVDGDDWLNYDMLESLVATLNSTNQIVDIVSTNMYRQEEDGSFFIQQQNYNNNICEGKTYFELIMRDKVNHHMFPKLYRREFVLSAGYLDYPEVTMAEDLMTNSLFGIHNPKVLFSNSTNYYYRYNATSVMRSGDNVLLSQIFTLKKMEEYFKKHNVYNEIIELLDYQWFSYVFTYTHTTFITI